MSARHRTRWYRIIVLLMLPTLLGLYIAPSRASAQNIVERWRGTIHASQRFNTVTTPLALVFIGSVLETYDIRYDLKVDDSGFVNGDVVVNLSAVSVQQTEKICLAGGLPDCTLSFQVTSGRGAYFVEGKRFADEQGKPRIKLENSITISEPQVKSTLCGLILGLFRHCERGEPGDWYLADTVTEFTITPYQYGRSPLATPINAHYSDETISWDYEGQLIGVGQEPLLEVNPELLEANRYYTLVPVDNQLDGDLDWNSPDGGWVTWQVEDNGTERTGPTKATRDTKRKNVGFTSPGTKQVQAQARNIIGKDSKPETLNITAIRWPVAAESPGNVTPTKTGRIVDYKFGYRFPNPKLEAKINEVPEWVPFFGGGPLGISDGQAGGDVEILSTGQGYAALTGGAVFEGMKGKLAAEITVKAETVMDQQYGLEFPSGEIGIKLGGKLTHGEPLLELIPALTGPINAIQRISPAAFYAINKLRIDGELAPSIETTVKLKDDKGNLAFDGGSAKLAAAFKIMLVLELIEDTLEAQVGGGLEYSQSINFPAPYLGPGMVKVSALAEVVFLDHSIPAEASYSFPFNGGLQLQAVDGIDLQKHAYQRHAAAPGWQPIARDYLLAPDYAQWIAPSGITIAATGETNDVQLVANVFPQAKPSLAVVSNQTGLQDGMLAWTHDRPGTGGQNGKEIVYALNDGGTWKPQMELTNDDRADWNPQVAYLPNQFPLVVWERFDTPNPGDFATDPNAYLSHMQIAVAAPNLNDPSKQPAPLQLSTSGSVNHRPQIGTLGTVNNSEAIVTWVNNPANLLVGDVAQPDSLMWARYTRSGNPQWSAPAPVLGPVPGLLEYKLATVGSHAAIVWSQDTDGNFDTTADRELFYTLLNNGTWGAPIRITNDAVADESPELVLNAVGEPLLVWHRGDQLVYVAGNWQAAPTAIIAPQAARRTDYQLVRAQDGTAALVWQEAEPTDTRIGYMVYDAVHGRWSDEQTVTPPPNAPGTTSMANRIAPALISGTAGYRKDQLIAAYQLATVTTTTRTVDGQPAEMLQFGPQSLRVVGVPLATDLEVRSTDLSVTPPQAAPGEQIMIHAAIHNTGHHAVENVPVRLNSRALGLASDQPDTIVMTRTLPLLPAGETYTVTFPLARPALADSDYAVQIPQVIGQCTQTNPEGQCIYGVPLETDYSDNYAKLGSALGLAPLPTLHAPQGAILQAAVQQSGGLYTTSPTTATLRLGSATGPVLNTIAVSFPVTPTDTITASSFISTTQLGRGRHTYYWEIDPGNQVGDTNRNDNTMVSVVDIQPDLSTDASLVGWSQAPGATAPISLRVQNEGNWPSGAQAVAVWDGPPGQPGSHALGRLPLSAIAPGGFAEIEGALNLAGTQSAASGLQRIFVQLDPDNQEEELNENNNLVLAGGVLGPPYPDIVVTPIPPPGGVYKVFLPRVQTGGTPVVVPTNTPTTRPTTAVPPTATPTTNIPPTATRVPTGPSTATINLTLTGGSAAGSHVLQATEDACGYGPDNPSILIEGLEDPSDSFTVEYWNDTTNAVLYQVELLIPQAGPAVGGTQRFYLNINDQQYYIENINGTNQVNGSVRVRRSGTTANLVIDATTDEGTRIEATIDCGAVTGTN